MRWPWLPMVVVVTVLAGRATPCPAAGGQLALRVVDADSGENIPFRMHLSDARGRPRKVPGLPFWKDHFVCDGSVTLQLPAGGYRFEIERGPEYRHVTGHFEIQRFANDEKTVELKRVVDMRAEGWWSGELHVHRPLAEIELLMRAEDLHVVPVITWWNNRNHWEGRSLQQQPVVRFDGDRFYHVLAGEDERGGGALLYFNLREPLPIAQAQREYPPMIHFLHQARQQPSAWVDLEKPFWWDAPVWLACGEVDSIGLCNNHLWRSDMLNHEAWGRPRDKLRFPDPWGNGQWSQQIYYHVLNCGLRIPPSAGSASGVHPNPVGYNRMYVYLDGGLDYDAWWRAFKAGRVMVTNGPLLRAYVAGKLPGHVFTAPEGEELELDVALNLATRDPIAYLEFVVNGRVVRTVRLEEYIDRQGQLPPLKIKESGWFLIRAVADVPKTYRFASTGPYYVQIGSRPFISRRSAQFFLDWVQQRMQNLELTDPQQRQEVLGWHQRAKQFWEDKVAAATAD